MHHDPFFPVRYVDAPCGWGADERAALVYSSADHEED
jgi:hypothetical protein